VSQPGHTPAPLNTAAAVGATPGACRGGIGCTGVAGPCAAAVGWCPAGSAAGTWLPSPEATPRYLQIPHPSLKP
jgi:hypothetical protein